MFDLEKYLSHPDKSLLDHTREVLNGVTERTSLKIAEFAAIFHDVGKINPNFQKKLDNDKVNGYSNHSYLSALAFFSYCAENHKNILSLFKEQPEWIASILAIISHHHTDFPNYPIILDKDECNKLTNFLHSLNEKLPISSFILKFLENTSLSTMVKPFSVLELENHIYDLQLRFSQKITYPIDYFLKTRFAFASLITADKESASGLYINKQNDVEKFCGKYDSKLSNYIESKFKSDSELNVTRTKMRKEAVKKLVKELKSDDNKKLFSLTAPTGSGKTIMMLSLANKILKHKGNYRIIYALPFLSITEQVEKICNDIFSGLEQYIQRIDSKSENKDFQENQEKLDSDPKAIEKILTAKFSEDTFNYPFIITTFVQVFETLLTNRNSKLLKFPNFSKTIFLIDEIQALPPRLYGFFIAILDAFCKEFDSYAIISTATMPNFVLPVNNIRHNLQDFFPNYIVPPELLSVSYFNEKVFNRYYVERLLKPIDIQKISNRIKTENKSVLVILNTIQDTKDLFEKLRNCNFEPEVILLNTHFIPNDRNNKIERANDLLNNQKQVIVISTQLIEAGVNIDFPVVYRDFCPISSIVQSAGRCNRNGKISNKGKIVLVDLQKNGKSRSKCIYKGRDKIFISFAEKNINDQVFEPNLFKIQKNFFNDIQHNTVFGLHSSSIFTNGEIDFVQRIKEAAFAEIGKFKLIDDKEYGEEKRYYIVENEQDNSFEVLQEYYHELKEIDYKNYKKRKLKLFQIEYQLKRMSGQIVNVRINQNTITPLADSEECFGLFKLTDSYNSITGIELSSINNVI